jgi:hypothetical protein
MVFWLSTSIRASLWTLDRSPAFPSRFLGKAVQLQHEIVIYKAIVISDKVRRTVDTSLGQHMQEEPAQGNPLCKGQWHILHGGNGHQGIGQCRALTFLL